MLTHFGCSFVDGFALGIGFDEPCFGLLVCTLGACRGHGRFTRWDLSNELI